MLVDDLVDALDKHLVRDANKVRTDCCIEIKPRTFTASPMLHAAQWGIEVPVYIVEADLLRLLKRTALNSFAHPNLDKFLRGV